MSSADRMIEAAQLLGKDLEKGAEAMANLAARRREILVILRHTHKMTVTQIAARLGMSKGRVSQMTQPGA